MKFKKGDLLVARHKPGRIPLARVGNDCDAVLSGESITACWHSSG